MSWFTESNRWKHFVLAIPAGLIGTIFFALGIATGLETKECQYDYGNDEKPIYKWNWNSWDWIDWWCTAAGGAVGQAIQILIICLFI